MPEIRAFHIIIAYVKISGNGHKRIEFGMYGHMLTLPHPKMMMLCKVKTSNFTEFEEEMLSCSFSQFSHIFSTQTGQQG
jgi:hypothetical protein